MWHAIAASHKNQHSLPAKLSRRLHCFSPPPSRHSRAVTARRFWEITAATTCCSWEARAVAPESLPFVRWCHNPCRARLVSIAIDEQFTSSFSSGNFFSATINQNDKSWMKFVNSWTIVSQFTNHKVNSWIHESSSWFNEIEIENSRIQFMCSWISFGASLLVFFCFCFCEM